MATDPLDSSHVLELAEETAQLTTKQTVTGRVRVSTQTETFEEVMTQDIHTTRTDVTCVAVGRILEAGEALPVVRTEGNVTIIPVFEEVAVVETRMVLKEELHIALCESAEPVKIPVKLRRQTATIERLEPDEKHLLQEGNNQ